MTEQGNEAEKEAIRRAILDYYTKGHDTCDPALYEEILHPQWRFILFDDQEELMIVDRSEYCSWYNPIEADPQMPSLPFDTVAIDLETGTVRLGDLQSLDVVAQVFRRSN